MIYNISAEKKITLLYSGINDVKQEMGERNIICRVPVLARARYIKCKQRSEAIRNEKQNTRTTVIMF